MIIPTNNKHEIAQSTLLNINSKLRADTEHWISLEETEPIHSQKKCDTILTGGPIATQGARGGPRLDCQKSYNVIWKARQTQSSMSSNKMRKNNVHIQHTGSA